ncbi:uncharacterized protein LOC105762032 [Gossypium raimondii]|uniref:uncharacterized protein LOC105762032 n=1 Tax=Gossypium raimondii TaxID=29730 RepID=UPI00063AC4A5|nr:uncharacterized protein LOC105762032 [Gossypium raimondii]
MTLSRESKPSENPTITNVLFDVANNSSFGDRSKRQHISDHKGGLLTTLHELSGVHTLSGDEQFLLLLVTEWVTEHDASLGRTAAWVVDNIGDDAFEVVVSFTEVEAAKMGGTNGDAEGCLFEEIGGKK